MAWSWPTKWEAVNLLLAVIGILMAALPLIALLYGQPRIDFQCDEEKINFPIYLHTLRCQIYNRPLTEENIAYRLGVQRPDIKDLAATFGIQEAGTRREVRNPIAAQFFIGSAPPDARITLASSPFPATFYIVKANQTDGTVTVVGDPSITLQPGRYVAVFEIVSVAIHKRIENVFVVTNAAPYVQWAS